jgi:hypothetical protein
LDDLLSPRVNLTPRVMGEEWRFGRKRKAVIRGDFLAHSPPTRGQSSLAQEPIVSRVPRPAIAIRESECHS